MDTKCRYVWLWAGTFALFAAGCNSDWMDRVPEVAAEPASQTQAAAVGQASGQSATSAAVVGSRPVESADDAALSSKVEMALESEPDLHGSAIAVRSHEGVVTLSGTTKDPQLRSMAAQVALSIDGVKLVRNDIALAHEA